MNTPNTFRMVIGAAVGGLILFLLLKALTRKLYGVWCRRYKPEPVTDREWCYDLDPFPQRLEEYLTSSLFDVFDPTRIAYVAEGIAIVKVSGVQFDVYFDLEKYLPTDVYVSCEQTLVDRRRMIGCLFASDYHRGENSTDCSTRIAKKELKGRAGPIEWYPSKVAQPKPEEVIS